MSRSWEAFDGDAFGGVAAVSAILSTPRGAKEPSLRAAEFEKETKTGEDASEETGDALAVELTVGALLPVVVPLAPERALANVGAVDSRDVSRNAPMVPHAVADDTALRLDNSASAAKN